MAEDRRKGMRPLRGSSLPALTLTLLAVATTLGCQTGAMPTEAARATDATNAPPVTGKASEATPVVPPASGNSFVPPPRSISDITAILDQQKRDKPEVVAEARQRADQPLPDSHDGAALARFYYQRGSAALTIGRSGQAIDDLTLAAQHVAQVPEARALEMQIRWSLYNAEIQAGSYVRAVAVLEHARERASPGQRSWLFNIDSDLVQHYVFVGRLDAADAMRREVVNLREEARHWQSRRPPAPSPNGTPAPRRLKRSSSRDEAGMPRRKPSRADRSRRSKAPGVPRETTAIPRHPSPTSSTCSGSDCRDCS